MSDDGFQIGGDDGATFKDTTVAGKTYLENIHSGETVPFRIGAMSPYLPGEQVNHPAHYGGDTTYETIKVIEAWGLGFNLGSALKYVSRADAKGNPIQDLEKAVWYLQREIERRRS